MMRAGKFKVSDLQPVAEPTPWIWEGYLAPGRVTLFTALWKSGKTTLYSLLLAQRKTGGALLGQAVSAGASVIVSEESPDLWRDRHERLGLNANDSIICRPFAGRPTPDDWTRLLDHLVAAHETDGADLAILDPISLLLPAYCESDANLLLKPLEQLHRLTDAGMAVLLVHHPRKAKSQAGATARGSGVMQSFVDIIMEMYRVSANDPANPRRRLLGFSRLTATPRSLLIEMDAEYKSYAIVDETEDEEFLKNWDAVRITLEDATGPLTRPEILEQWPDSFPCPKSLTLWRWLDHARDRGLVRRAGAGNRNEPFRYFLPGSEE